jgi:hypothetical protein
VDGRRENDEKQSQTGYRVRYSCFGDGRELKQLFKKLRSITKVMDVGC